MSSQATAPDADRHLRMVSRAPHVATADALANLPPVIDLLEAAALLGLGRTTAYTLVRLGTWPTPIIRIGRLIKVPTSPLRELLDPASSAVRE